MMNSSVSEFAIGSEEPGLKKLSLGQSVLHPFWVTYCIIRMWMLVAWESLVVVYLIRKMKAGLLPAEHPWNTGLDPKDGGYIWTRNLVYRSNTHRADVSLEQDEAAVIAIGKFMAGMTRRSIPDAPETPQGPTRRMPHAVNYLHGAVHFNCLFMVFDDFADVIYHLTDPDFRRDMLRFARRHQREVTLVMRTRHYDPLDYAYCVGTVRTLVPWFSNGNGPTKKPVLWGNAAPYPAIALINGAWMNETFALLHGDTTTIARPPVQERDGFRARYQGTRRTPIWFDRLLAWQMYLDVRSRGFRGQLAFTNRRIIEPRRLAEYEKAGGYWRWSACYPVPHPFQREAKSRERLRESETDHDE